MNESLSMSGSIGRGECLEQFTVRILRAGRIHDQSIACAELFKRRLLAVVELNGAALDADLDLSARYDADPVIAADHDVAACALDAPYRLS